MIELLSRPGELVLDPFCGSGTALVEALRLGRRAVGGDLNPVALVSSRAKTRRLSASQLARLDTLAINLPKLTREVQQTQELTLPIG